MNHPPAAGVNTNMGNRAAAVGAKKQQIARQYLALRTPGLELLRCGARRANAGLTVGVMDQTAAINAARRRAAQHIRRTQ